MKKFTLLLDESGKFKEQNKNSEPSIVAGLLIEGALPTEEWARSCLQRVKQSNSAYSAIDTRNFHAMEETSPAKADFITDLLCSLAKAGGKIVSFVNQKDIVIVNSDITYLNVFVNGTIALVRDLLKDTDEEVSLGILYAHRQEDLMREEHNLHIRINQEEYEKRLRERLELFIAKMPSTDRKKIRHRIDLQTDNAMKNPLLMLADGICFALRGGRGIFHAEQNERIRQLPHLSYVVPEKESWGMLQDSMGQNHYAEAIFLWYGGLQDDLGKYKDDFHKRLVQYFQNSDEAEKEVATTILSQYLQQLIKQRRFGVANQFMDGMDTDFIPLMRKNRIDFERLYFDLHFSRLTTATHQGDCRTGEKEKALCREALKKFPVTYETLDYYLRYKIREVEHLKNCYDFRHALVELDQLEKILTNMVDLVQLVDELSGYAKGITSNTLGSVYGSRIMTRCYLGLTEPEQFNLAREDFERAIEQFSHFGDQRRDCQSRAAVEYTSGHYEEALSYLSLAFMEDGSTNAQQVLDAILKDKSGGNRLFGMMHYTSAMAKAMLDDDPLGVKMFEVWCSHEIDFGTNGDEYPISIILWRLATCAALQNLRPARRWYERAIEASMRNDNADANIVIGLTIQMERLALLPFNLDRNIKRLQNDYKQFMSNNPPKTMRLYCSIFGKLISGVTISNINQNKKRLIEEVKRIPVL